MTQNAQLFFGFFGLAILGFGYLKILSMKPKPVDEKEKEIFK